MKLSDYVMEFVRAQGVKHVFFLTGGGAMHLNDSLGQCTGIQPVCVLHEQAAAIAAEAYAKVTGGLGAVMVTTGPGGTNAITGVAGAWLDSTPVLIISGQVKRADIKGNSGVRNKGVQELDIVTIVQSITKYAVLVMEPETIRYHLEKAVYLATSGRPGPVWIDIPLDVQASEVAPEKLAGFSPVRTVEALPERSLSEQVARTIARLQKAERPFLLLGNGIRSAGAVSEMRRFLELVEVPFGLTWLALDFVPDNHRWLMGRPGPMAPRAPNFALQNSDFLLTIGARLDVVCTGYAPERLARGAEKIMVDIDPAEVDKLKPYLSMGICADARAFLQEMIRQLPASGLRCGEGWGRRCAEWKAKYPLTVPDYPQATEAVSLYRFTEELCRALPEDALVVSASSGNAIETFLLAYRAKAGQRVFHTTGLGSMGFGVPASIGGCLAYGRRTTVCVEGDGGFQMNSQELETIARLKLPIKLFVVNNGGYGSIVASQMAYFHRLVGCTPQSGLTLPDTLKLGAVYGLPVMRIGKQTELQECLRSVLSREGPCLCEVVAIPDEPRQPRLSSYQKPDGSMASRPLEDLFPFLPREEFLANMIVPPVEE